MFSVKIYILNFILLISIVQIKTLVELPVAEDNNLAIAESAIRNTVINLFAVLRIPDIKLSNKFRQFCTVHNFFVSITLKDCDNLKEIARLTRVNDINNNTRHFIAQINEILNEDNKSYEGNDNNDRYVTEYINTFTRKLKYLKELYVSKTNTDINAKIINYLDNSGKPSTNVTDDHVLSDSEFWQPSGRRIYQGIRTNIKTYPFMASVHFFKKFQCGGSIIKSDLVITSSSCLQIAWNNRFFRENPLFLSVQVGSNFYEFGGETIAVLDIYFHPFYNPKTLRNNLAIIRLTRNIFFKKSHGRIKKIQMDKNPWPMPSNSGPITIIGWGSKYSHNVVKEVFINKLAYADLDFYPLRDCQDHYSPEFVTEINFCAGFFSKGSGACNRDAGDPGILDGILMGVTSFGSPTCGAANSPTVFTKLGYYTDWIENIMEQMVPRSRSITTTLGPNIHESINSNKMTTLKHIKPIDLPGMKEDLRDNARLNEDQEFKDFLSTVFDTDDSADKSNSITEKQKKEKTSEIEADLETGYITETTKAMNKLTQPTTTSIRIEFSDDSESTDSSENIEDPNFKSTTRYTRPVTKLENMDADDDSKLEDVDGDDKTLEDEIINLIDNLDINKILETEDLPLTKTGHLKQNESNEDEKSTSESSNTSDENGVSSPKRQTNFIKENDSYDDHGLSIEATGHKDLTLRHKSNRTDANVLLSSEDAIYDFISHAIDEQAKRLRKKKGFSL